MVPVAAQDRVGVGRGDRAPIEQVDVGELRADQGDRVIDLATVLGELGHRQQHDRRRRQPLDDLLQLLAIRLLIAEVVGAEEHVGGVPLRRKPLVEHRVAEVDEPARLGVDLDLPAERHQRLAQLAAVALRREAVIESPIISSRLPVTSEPMVGPGTIVLVEDDDDEETVVAESDSTTTTSDSGLPPGRTPTPVIVASWESGDADSTAEQATTTTQSALKITSRRARIPLLEPAPAYRASHAGQRYQGRARSSSRICASNSTSVGPAGASSAGLRILL